jgi:hypothetical protein
LSGGTSPNSRLEIDEVRLKRRRELFRRGSVRRALSSNGGWKTSSYRASRYARASDAAVLRIALRLSSGLNGLPFSMPIDFSGSIIARSRSSQGSIWIYGVERLEEAQIVRDDVVVDDVDAPSPELAFFVNSVLTLPQPHK